MKNMLKNKKGFTLVELLAVIVILALLIVITANTVLPMMNSSKNSSMVTFAERVMAQAATQYQADTITGTTSDFGEIEDGVAYYSIKLLMNTDEYFGCVKFDSSSTATHPYSILMYNNKDSLKIEGKSSNSLMKKKASDYASGDSFAITGFDEKTDCKGKTYNTSVDLNS